MKDFSQLLIDKKEIIVENWLKKVHEDNQIESLAIVNHLEYVLLALATVLCKNQHFWILSR